MTEASKPDLGRWADAFPDCVKREDSGGCHLYPFSLTKLDLAARVDAEAFLLDVLRLLAGGSPEERRRESHFHPVAYACQALLTVSRGRAGALLGVLDGEEILARLEPCNRAAIRRVRRHLAARAGGSACPCASGRDDAPEEEPDVDVEQREELPPPDPKNVGKHEIHLRCRCRACGARWLVVKHCDWERFSFAWSRSDDA